MNSSSLLQSSVSRRVIWPVLAILLLGNAALIWNVWNTSTTEVEEAAILSASATVDQYKQLRAYYNESVVKKVRAHTQLKVGSGHAAAEDMIPLPATMIHDLSERLKNEKTGVQVRLYSDHPFPNRKDRVLDPFMRDALSWFSTHSDGRFTRRTKNEAGDETIRVAITDKLVADSCVTCHNTHPDSPKRDWKLGDVRGVLDVEMNISHQLESNRAMVAQLGLLTFLMLLFMGALIWLIVHRNVTRPLNHAVAIVEQVVQSGSRRGERNGSLDEIGRISSALSGMIIGIRDRLHTIGQNARAVAGSAQSLSAISTQVSAAAEETSNQSRSASESATQVNRSVQTVASASEEMAASISEIARNVGQATKVANHAVTVAERTNATVARLGDSSGEIGNVLKVISNIANQTNLLALNATIEAARAGEMGKGFAVVANEVKELARQTAHATEGIRDRIGAIQGDTAKSVAAIKEITGIIKEIAMIQAVIAGAVDQQSVTTNEITSNTHIAAKGSAEIARNITGVADAARGTNDGAAQTAAAAAELARLAEELQRVLGEFTLQETGVDVSANGEEDDLIVRRVGAEVDETLTRN